MIYRDAASWAEAPPATGAPSWGPGGASAPPAGTRRPLATSPLRADARTRLAALIPLRALSDHLGAALAIDTRSCDQTFSRTHAHVAETIGPDAAETVLQLLRSLGATCDCEVYILLHTWHRAARR